MASNQPTQAIDVIPSDNINIPEPGSYITGVNSGSGTTLTTVGAKFLGTFNPAQTGYSNKVAAGDVIYEGSNIVTVVSVDSDEQLTVSGALTGAGAPYQIYRANTAASEGFSLFVGTAGDLVVIPASSGDIVKLKNVANNSYVPLQVARVLSSSTTAGDIIALR
jgi:hypothetical protein